MNWILDILFPKYCVGCKKPGKYVCDKCQIGLWEQDQICPGCGRLSPGGVKHATCRLKSQLNGLVCFWAHEGVAKKLLHRANSYYLFDYLQQLTTEGAGLVGQPELAQLRKFILTRPVVIALPASSKERRLKGFNSAEVVGKRMARLFHLPYGISRASIPKRVLVVTDLWTPSGRMEKAAEILKKANVKQVWGLALAR